MTKIDEQAEAQPDRFEVVDDLRSMFIAQLLHSWNFMFFRYFMVKLVTMKSMKDLKRDWPHKAHKSQKVNRFILIYFL